MDNSPNNPNERKHVPMTELPRKVIDEDHRLEGAAERSGEALAKHRWHWTLDETNAKRISLRAYADSVQRSHQAISTMVKGYATWVATPGVATRSLNDVIQLGKHAEDKRAAIKALADATGKSVGNVATHKLDEVRSVILSATERAERRGTTVEEEIPRVALSRARTQTLNAKTARERRARHGLRYIQIDGKILSAKRYLMQALEISDGVAFDEEEKELLRDAIANLVALMHLIDARLGGRPDIDWDAELAKLGQG